MVAPIILAVGIIASIVFFARGGLEQFQAFAESVVSKEDREKGTAVTPTLQTGEGSVPIASGSQRTVNSIESSFITRTDVANKRKFSPMADKPQISVTFNNPIEGGVLASQQGQIVGANLSIQSGQQFGTGQFGLNQTEISEIRSQDFTDQEKQDISALTLRFNRKSASAQKVSDAPEEIIFKKREQEAIARKVLIQQGGTFVPNSANAVTRGGFVIFGKGGLNASPSFALGGKSLEEFNKDQAEKARIDAKIAQNKILQQQRIETGEQIISTIKKSGLNQKQFLERAGIALRGGDLSALAIGKLQARGISFSARAPRAVVEPRTFEPARLTSSQVFQLSDAEKIARFRRGERFT